MNRLLVILLLCIAMVQLPAQAQAELKPFARHFDVSQGLANNNVYGIAEDPLHRIWLATSGGVSILDGLGVTNLTKDSQLNFKLRSNIISHVFSYQNQMIVVGLSGIDRVDPSSLRAVPVPDPNQWLVRANNVVLADQGVAFVVAEGRFVRWQLQTDALSLLSPPPDAHEVLSMKRMSSGAILLLSDRGFFVYHPDSNQYSAFTVTQWQPETLDIRYFHGDSQGRVWFSVFGQGLFVVDKGQVTQRFNEQNGQLSSNMVSELIEKDQQLYAVTRRGVDIFDVRSLQRQTSVQPDSADQVYQKADMALTGYLSSAGELLIGATNGFYAMPLKQGPYRRFSALLPEGAPAVFHEHFTFNNELYARQGQQVTYSVGIESANPSTAQFSYPATLGDPIAQSGPLMLFQQNTIGWFDGEFHWENLSARLPNVSLLSIFQGATPDEFYALSTDFLFVLKIQQQQLQVVRERYIGFLLIADVLEHQGQLYLASQKDGLISIPLNKISDPTVEPFKHAGPDLPFLLYVDQQKTLWVLTAESGVFAKAHGEQAFKQIDVPSFPGEQFSPSCMVQDAQQDYWFSNKWGIQVFDAQLQLKASFGSEVGLYPNLFGKFGCGALGNGVYFWGQNDAYMFQMQAKDTAISPPQLGISAITHDQVMADKDSQSRFVEPGVLSFQLYAPGLNFDPSQRLHYRIRQQTGRDANEPWISLNARDVLLISPKQGHYQLETQLSRGDGRRSQFSYPFVVDVPYYRHPTMLLLYVLSGIAFLLYFFYIQLKLKDSRLHMARLKSEQQEQYSAQLAHEVEEKTRQYKEQQQLAVKANLDKTRFIASVSHDLRAPLNAIRWKLESVLSEEHQDKAALMDEILMLDRLVESIVNLSKFDANVIKPSLNVFAIQPLLKESIERFSLTIRQKNIQVSFEPAEPAILVLSDRFLLSRLVNNLLDNAIKILPHDGQIRLDLQVMSPAQVRLQIIDNGPGIDVGLKNKVFEPFVRGTQNYVGTGLGLTIVRQISEVLALQLQLDSSEQGSCFTLWLDLAEGDLHEVADQQALTALVIDDDPYYGNDIAVLLKRLGYQVTLVSGPDQFTEQTQRFYNLVICDFNLGLAQNGLEWLKEQLFSGLVDAGLVIIVSEDTNVRQLVQQQSEFSFLNKPIKSSKLSWLLQHQGA